MQPTLQPEAHSYHEMFSLLKKINYRDYSDRSALKEIKESKKLKVEYHGI